MTRTTRLQVTDRDERSIIVSQLYSSVSSAPAQVLMHTDTVALVFIHLRRRMIRKWAWFTGAQGDQIRNKSSGYDTSDTHSSRVIRVNCTGQQWW